MITVPNNTAQSGKTKKNIKKCSPRLCEYDVHKVEQLIAEGIFIKQKRQRNQSIYLSR